MTGYPLRSSNTVSRTNPRGRRKPNCKRFPSKSVIRFLPILILDVSRATGVFVVSVDNPHMSQNLSMSSSRRPHASQ